MMTKLIHVTIELESEGETPIDPSLYGELKELLEGTELSVDATLSDGMDVWITGFAEVKIG